MFPPMLTLTAVSAFLFASIVITLAPGPDNLMVLGYSLSRGRATGFAIALGCALGCFTHTLWAALGFSALVLAMPGAFFTLKLLGAAYLLWLGVGALRSRARSVHLDSKAITAAAPQPMWRNVVRGFVANAVNPKVALFFMAFLPQFVTAGAPAGPQMVVLGALFAVQTVIVFGAIAAAAGTLGGVLARKPQLAAWLDRGSGALLIALAVHLLVSPRPA